MVSSHFGKVGDGGRLATAMPDVVGKRLTYKVLIGQDESTGALANGNDAGKENPAN
jgi:hypothetical protein